MHLWEAKHPYACADGNYHSNEWTFRFGSWSDFIDEWGAADKDYNLVFRWDWRPETDDWARLTERGKTGGGELQICYVLQRKGCYATCFVQVEGTNEDAVRKWLADKAEHMRKIWSPLLTTPPSPPLP